MAGAAVVVPEAPVLPNNPVGLLGALDANNPPPVEGVAAAVDGVPPNKPVPAGFAPNNPPPNFLS